MASSPAPANSPGYKTVKGYILRTTDKAVQFECHELNGLPVTDENDNPRKEWFPVSQLKQIHKERAQSEMDYIVASDWILRTKEFI